MPSPPPSPHSWRSPSPIPARSESPYGGSGLAPLPTPTFLDQLTLMVRMFHMGRDSHRTQTSLGPFRNVLTGHDELFPRAFIEKVSGAAMPRSAEEAAHELRVRTTVFEKILRLDAYGFGEGDVREYLAAAGFSVELDLVKDVMGFRRRYGGPE